MSEFPPKRVIVGMDFSAPSKAALELARGLAKAWKARLELVYIQTPLRRLGAVDLNGAPVYVPATGREVVAVRELRQRELSRVAGSNGVKTRARFGWPAEELVRLTRSRESELLVIGTRHYSAVERLFLSSVAEGVIARAQAPVLVTHAGRSTRPIKRILVPWNMTAYADAALRYAVGLAGSLRARVQVLYVSPLAPDKFSRGMVEKRLPLILGERAKTVECKVVQGDARSAIFDQARKGNADLIVLSAHRRKYSADFIIGTTAQAVLRHSKVPVLAVPSTEGRHERRRRLVPHWAVDKIF